MGLKKYARLIGIVLIAASAAYFLVKSKIWVPKAPDVPEMSAPENSVQEPNLENKKSGFVSPLDRVKERVTKKPFGILIDPNTSPVQPERFRGYHAGTDFEIFPEEADAEVAVRAVCTGRIIEKRSVSGYGGVAIQSCRLDNQPITILYGHLAISSVKMGIDAEIKAGEMLGNLGQGYSRDTDGERKHLHLSFHKGNVPVLSGYVSQKSVLEAWLDPCRFICD